MRQGLLVVLAVSLVMIAAGAVAAGTLVPGHDGRHDGDNNGYPDAGKIVNGKYESVYAYDENGDYYWDLGDGRIYSTVDSIEDLDAATLTVCTYQVQYRGDFGNDPYMDSGWIINAINCVGYDPGTYLYLMVHKTDPRYTGNPDWALWGDWEYHVLVESGTGNWVKRFAAP